MPLLAALFLAAPLPQIALEGAGRPRLSGDFADPFLLAAHGRIYAFATNSGGANVPVARSTDLSHWHRLPGDALPKLPPWARPGFTWAPEVLALNRRYLLYFTARERVSGWQCVGLAEARRPHGPYRSQARAPLLCQRGQGGTIDPSPFCDPHGRLYLYFKNDGNRIGRPSRLYGVRLRADGRALGGAPVPLIANRARWQGAVVEAPTMAWHHGYWLFFSGGDYGWPAGRAASAYAIGVARCAGPLGPCRAAPAPLLASRRTPCLSGPGHQALLAWRGATHLAFHAWDVSPGCGRGAPLRRLHLARLRW